MKKLFPLSLPLAVVLCAMLPFSCSTGIDMPKSPAEFTEPAAPGTSSSGGGSSSSTTFYDYCVFDTEGECLDGPIDECPPGGTLGNSCPYNSPNHSSSSSEPSEPSSSSGPKCPAQTKPNYFTDQRDCREYEYEYVGGKYWMKENLNYSKDGTIGYCYKTGAKRFELGTPGEEDLPGCDSPYGRAYTYAMAVDGNPSLTKAKGVCPDGWHIPNAAEWAGVSSTSLSRFYSGNYDLLTEEWKNKSVYGFYWFSNAVISSSQVGFVFIFSSIEVRTSSEVAKPNDVFYVRCVADDDWQPPVTSSSSGGSSVSSSSSQSSSSSVSLCGVIAYDPSTQFCSNNAVKEKCDGLTFDPLLEECKNNEVVEQTCDENNAVQITPIINNVVTKGDCKMYTCSGNSSSHYQLANYGVGNLTLKLTGACNIDSYSVLPTNSIPCNTISTSLYMKVISGSTTQFQIGCW
jgi:hypothetical protein